MKKKEVICLSKFCMMSSLFVQTREETVRCLQVISPWRMPQYKPDQPGSYQKYSLRHYKTPRLSKDQATGTKTEYIHQLSTSPHLFHPIHTYVFSTLWHQSVSPESISYVLLISRQISYPKIISPLLCFTSIAHLILKDFFSLYLLLMQIFLKPISTNYHFFPACSFWYAGISWRSDENKNGCWGGYNFSRIGLLHAMSVILVLSPVLPVSA